MPDGVLVTFDSETPPIARMRLAQTPVCGQWSEGDGPTHLELWSSVPFRDWIESGATIVGANIAYDMACALVDNPDLCPQILAAYDAGRIRDVQLDCKLLDIADGEYARYESTGGWNLQRLAKRINIRIEKDSDDETGAGSWRLRFAQLIGVPIANWPNLAVSYATEEIPATRAVHFNNERRAAEWRARGFEVLGWHSKHAVCSALALHLMPCWGVLTDRASVESVSARTEAYLADIGGHLNRLKISTGQKGFEHEVPEPLVRGDGSHDTKAAARLMVDSCLCAGREVAPTKGAEKKLSEAISKLLALRAETPSKAIAKKIAAVAAQWYHPDPFAADSEKIHLPGVSIDKDACILSSNEDLVLYAEHFGASLLRSRIDRMREGYVIPLQGRFDPLKETGRTSATQPSEPLVGDQMQNYPRSSGITREEKLLERKQGRYYVGLRECYRPRDGFDFIVADISQAELHCLAQICLRLFGHSEMATLLNSGTDLHWAFAAKSLGLPLDQVATKTATGWKATRPEYKEHRDRAKPANFGFPGGMGPDKFILYARKGFGVKFERDEVVALKAAWLDTFPEVREYLAWISWQLRQQGGSFTHIHPITGFVRGGCEYTEGSNHGFQHLCAYGAKEALWEVTKRCLLPGFALSGSRPWNFVHDEIVGESPCDRSSDAAEEMGQVITTVFNAYVPDVPTSAEGFASRVWSKAAKAVRGPDGRLVPWTPPIYEAA